MTIFFLFVTLMIFIIVLSIWVFPSRCKCPDTNKSLEKISYHISNNPEEWICNVRSYAFSRKPKYEICKKDESVRITFSDYSNKIIISGNNGVVDIECSQHAGMLLVIYFGLLKSEKMEEKKERAKVLDSYRESIISNNN
jgi:hypothetical protein